jgi:hypothetical protein
MNRHGLLPSISGCLDYRLEWGPAIADSLIKMSVKQIGAVDCLASCLDSDPAADAHQIS